MRPSRVRRKRRRRDRHILELNDVSPRDPQLPDRIKRFGDSLPKGCGGGGVMIFRVEHDDGCPAQVGWSPPTVWYGLEGWLHDCRCETVNIRLELRGIAA